MKVLVIGSGGREHALSQKIAESPSLTKLFASPGNPGIASIAELVNLNISNNSEVVKFCKENSVDLVIIGPEKPLVDRLADDLRSAGIKVFGPDSAAAEIEAHKSFSKGLMRKYNIPTAEYIEFRSDELERAAKYLSEANYPLVIKADGLAAGKGVIICKDQKDADETLTQLFVNRIFGSAGDKIIVEEFMTGEEASVFAITDGTDYVCLPAAQDHKRIGDNDTGKNTGGMGAYAPAPLITDILLEEIKTKIIEPTLSAMRSENRTFNGCLYCGLMITAQGPKVVEFNCRFGDPETQAVLPLLEGDFLKLLYSAADGRLDKTAVRYNGAAAVCVVAASGGYPDQYNTGYEISGLETDDPEVIVYHAGTGLSENKIVTAGGRVLGVTALDTLGNLRESRKKAYEVLSRISFTDIYYRKDIAVKALK